MIRRPFCIATAALGLLGSIAVPGSIHAQDLALNAEDVRLEARDDGGYDLFVRKKPDIASVLLTETTKDPALRADNFAYRAKDYNSVNGSEKRLLNGKFLPAANKLYSLISSTPVPDEGFGQAFRILIPPVLEYGYSWSRSGSVSVGKGTFINIRAFLRPYADYRGSFVDNPYQITVSATPPEPPPPPPSPPVVEAPAVVPATPPPGNYDADAARAFTALADKAKGKVAYGKDNNDTVSQIGELLDQAEGESLDLVLCLDTTGSMGHLMQALKLRLTPLVREKVAKFKSFRVGLMLFKDYWPDEYITKKIPFMTNLDIFDRYIRGITAYGGGDIPEAVHEGVYASATEFDWKADKRIIILIGDAPPHPVPRGKITFENVIEEVTARNIELDAIIVPQDFAGNGSQ